MSHGEYHSDGAQRVDRLMQTLASSSRREVVHYFETRAQGDTDSLATVVSHLDGRMPARNPAELEAALHHTHLPKLDERGWLDYEPDAKRIHYHGRDDAGALLSELAAMFSG